MHRVFISTQDIFGKVITITNKEILHHAKNVLRIKQGDEMYACDEHGVGYQCIVGEVSSSSLTLKVIKKTILDKTSNVQLTIACAIPKNAKFDDIVDKLTQLGTAKLIPLDTERVIVRLDKKKADLRLERWKRISLNASCQSQRNNQMIIDNLKSFDELLADSKKYDLKLIPSLIGRRKKIKEVIAGNSYKTILILIGPEGDFTEEEVEKAVKSCFVPVTLGNLVLRVDTAAIAVASFILLNEDN